jgi:hypothetical protein
MNSKGPQRKVQRNFKYNIPQTQTNADVFTLTFFIIGIDAFGFAAAFFFNLFVIACYKSP